MDRQRKILVIDDAALFRDLASFVLDRSGRVMTATSGEEGLAAARRDHPEVVVVDLDLPGIGGDTVCKEIRADPTLAETAVVLVTSGESAECHERAVRAGADDILSKPLNQRSLVLAVNRFLRFPVVRALRRAPLDTPVEIRWGDESVRGVARDVSRAGIFVAIDRPIPEGTEVALAFRLPESRFALRPTAQVIRSRDGIETVGPGTAFRFLAIDRDSAERLAQYVQVNAFPEEAEPFPVG